jgi:hypothetical protein
MTNLWIDLDYRMKERILLNAVRYGYLKKDFVKDMLKLEKPRRKGKNPR